MTRATTPATVRARRGARNRLWHRDSRRGEAGTTLVELLVSSVVITVLLVTVALALLGMTRTTAALDASAVAAGEATTLSTLVTRSLASATLVNPPTTVGSDVYLEALTLPAAGTTGTRCVQWRVLGSGGLVQVRSWTSGATSASSWSTVVDGVVDAGTPPFAVLPSDGDWATARVVLDVHLRRAGGGTVTASAVVAVVDGTGTLGGVATDPVCTALGRS